MANSFQVPARDADGRRLSHLPATFRSDLRSRSLPAGDRVRRRRAPPFWNGCDFPGNSVFLGGLAHDRRLVAAEDLLGLVHVVGSAPQGDVLDGGRALVTMGLDVVQLEEGRLGAPPLPAYERALRSVAAPHRATDVPRNAARPLLDSA